jgi:hypothetical protein
MKGLQNMVYLFFAAGMLVYAVPQLRVGHGFSLETIFAMAWTSTNCNCFTSIYFIESRSGNGNGTKDNEAGEKQLVEKWKNSLNYADLSVTIVCYRTANEWWMLYDENFFFT